MNDLGYETPIFEFMNLTSKFDQRGDISRQDKQAAVAEVERGGMKTCVLSERREGGGLCSFVNSGISGQKARSCSFLSVFVVFFFLSFFFLQICFLLLFTAAVTIKNLERRGRLCAFCGKNKYAPVNFETIPVLILIRD